MISSVKSICLHDPTFILLIFICNSVILLYLLEGGFIEAFLIYHVGHAYVIQTEAATCSPWQGNIESFIPPVWYYGSQVAGLNTVFNIKSKTYLHVSSQV